MIARPLAYSIGLTLITASSVLADIVQYNSNPGAYSSVTTSGLVPEYGANPVTETTLQYYTVNGVGPATLNMRFKADLGSYLFNFGAYRVTPALLAIDTSTDAGKIAYATQALAAGNAELIFDDATDDPFPGPGSIASLTMIGANTIMGGDTLGFFLIPNSTLSNFQTNQGQFSLTGDGFNQPPFAWPLFGDASANPGGFDQLMSFDGTSIVTGNPTSLFAWEDLTRAGSSDNSFSDLIFTVEGVTASPIPEPATLGFGIALCAALGLSRSRRAQRKA